LAAERPVTDGIAKGDVKVSWLFPELNEFPAGEVKLIFTVPGGLGGHHGGQAGIGNDLETVACAAPNRTCVTVLNPTP